MLITIVVLYIIGSALALAFIIGAKIASDRMEEIERFELDLHPEQWPEHVEVTPGEGNRWRH